MKASIILINLFFSVPLLACDICGNFMGLTPYDNQSQIALLHRYRVFNGYRNYQQRSVFFIPGAYKTAHGPGSAHDSVVTYNSHSSKDFESFKVLELRGKYFLSPRIELNAIVPVQQIRLKHDTQRQASSGLGDPSVMVAWHLLRRLGDYKFRHRLSLGAGLKLPAGNYRLTGTSGQRLFLLNQNGSGSWDHFYYLNYTLRHKRIGLNTNSLLKINTANRYQERLGNSFNQALLVFVPLAKGKWQFFPAALASYEYSRGLYFERHLQTATGMNLLMLGPSLDVLRNNLVFNLCFQFNVRERVASQSLSAAGRVVVGLTWNFMQKKYLFNS